MNRISIAVSTGALIFAGISTASAQTIIVGSEPVYDVAPPPVYAAPMVVAPAPRVYVAPAPVYAAPVLPPRPLTREVVVTEPEPAWAAAPGVIYSNW